MNRRHIFIFFVSIFFLLIFQQIALAADDFLILNFNPGKIFYQPNEKFSGTISLTSNNPQPYKNATVSFAIYERLELESEDLRAGKTLFTQKWQGLSLKQGEKELKVEKPISALKIKEGAYPVLVTVRQKNNILAEKESMLIVMSDSEEKKQTPLAAVFLLNFNERVHFNPQGIFLDEKLQEEVKDISSNPNRYAKYLDVLLKRPDIKTNIALNPVLIQQLVDIGNGYRAYRDKKIAKVLSSGPEAQGARDIIEKLKEVYDSEKIEFVSIPYANPSFSFLSNKGWNNNISFHLDAGEEILTKVLGFNFESRGILSLTPFSTNAIAPIAKNDFDYVVLNWSSFESILKNKNDDIYKTYQIQDLKNNRLTVLFNDDKTTAYLKRKDTDSAVRILLGRLAEIYLKRPDEQKAAVILFPDNKEQSSEELLERLYAVINDVFWIKTVKLKEAVSLVSPPGKPSIFSEEEKESYIKTQYYKRLTSCWNNFDLYAKMTDKQNLVRKKLLEEFLIAESNDWVDLRKEPEIINIGLSYIENIEEKISSELNKIKIITKGKITLSGPTGKVPVAILNQTGYPVSVSIALSGNNLSFPDGSIKTKTLELKENLFVFPVISSALGASQLKVKVYKKERVIDQVDLTINATYFGRTLLVVTIIFILALGVFFLLRRFKIGKRVR
ncbi:MAG: hypothetical protein HY776_01575 [Actinobacteria bacterium]|nr:hypothetical protein [Actinomycetota bacterium]